MKILILTIIYSSLVILISLLGMFQTQEVYTLLPLPFGLAIFSFSSIGLKQGDYEPVMRTILILAVFLLLGTSTNAGQLIVTILKFEDQFPLLAIVHSIVFVLSLFYLLTVFILLRRKKML